MPNLPLRPLSVAMLSFFSSLALAQDNTDLKLETGLSAPGKSLEEPPIFIRAMTIKGHQDQETDAEGDVELRREGQVLYSDWLRYNQPTDEAHGIGHVRVERQGDVLQGDELKLKLKANEGNLTNPTYQISRPKSKIKGRGDGTELIFAGEGHYKLKKASFTTCELGQDDWFIRVRDLDLNRSTNIGTARNATIEFKGVPILYTPWMTFPLSDERKSGFLTPSFGSTGKGGFEFTQPYYFNIAPNYDATFSPRLIARRGLQLNNEFRYLQPTYSGELGIEYLPNDRAANRDRYLGSLRHRQAFLPGLAGSLDLNKVSDDFYFQDLSTRVANTSARNLPQQGELTYGNGPWSFLGRVQRFQTLQDPNAPIVPPYFRLPQLQANYHNLDLYGFDILGTSEYVNFRHPTLPNGRRFIVYPGISYPFISDYGYITPKIGVHATRYQLDTPLAAGVPTTIQRTLPIFSIDSGVTFEREFAFAGLNLTQTLEPRIYYVRIPYRDQSAIPNFDTTEVDLNFAQIFGENRFSGADRINDANQATVGVTSRFIETATGVERLRAAVAQRYYFADQRVTLTSPPPNTRSSDILAALSGQINRNWWLDTGIQYNPNLNQGEKFNVAARYAPEPGKVLNFAYRFTRASVKQVDVSTEWPLTSRWSLLGRINYSIPDKKMLEGLAGLEYNAGCWAFRSVIHRFVSNLGVDTNAVFFQLELNGVSRIGSNPLEVLKQSIYGYTKTNEIPQTSP